MPAGPLTRAIRPPVDAAKKLPSVSFAVSWLVPFSPIQVAAQLCQFGIPELLVIANPVEHFLEPPGLKPVDAHAALSPLAHQSRRPQHREVLRNGWLADTKGRPQVTRRTLSCGQQVENPAPRCIRDHMKNVR